MAVVINTELFKQAVNKASKCASFNKSHPITSLIGITKADDSLTLTTTDRANILYIKVPAEGEDFDITVELDLFNKLISKSTSSDITLDVVDNSLVVKANGEYKIPIISDESGRVTFQKPEFDKSHSIKFEADLSSILKVYRNNEMAVAKTFELPALMGYYFGDYVVTSNSKIITFTDVKFADKPILMNARTVMLLSNITEPKVECYYNETSKDLAFFTDTFTLIGKELAGIEDFPIDAISNYKDIAFENACSISKDLLVAALDRITLFVDDFDGNGAYFKFGNNELILTNRKGNFTEKLSCESDTEFKCFAEVPTIKGILSTITDDMVTIKYGIPNAIGIAVDDTLHIISLLEVVE